MTLKEVKEILSAKCLCREDLLETDVLTACGSDMMSDVLANVKDQAVLLTGLANLQTIRTAIMMDMKCVCYVRSKQPDEKALQLAEESGIVILATDEKMFAACGMLYEHGLRGGL